jgi:hypothetical protein
MIDWKPIDIAPKTEPILVTSEHFPGWFAIGGLVLSEWRKGHAIAGDLMEHHPTHWERLTPVQKRKTS